ncbi:Histone-lysine N-methyltransferase setd3 [Sesbania bispinosa]|nr:Histone-lysine N-methyltransferase setd3 [Sesbania bispinosa]
MAMKHPNRVALILMICPSPTKLPPFFKKQGDEIAWCRAATTKAKLVTMVKPAGEPILLLLPMWDWDPIIQGFICHHQVCLRLCKWHQHRLM